MKLGHADSHGRKLIQHLFAEGRKSTDGSVVFRLAEVAGVLRIDAKVANQTLSRLRQGGLVERLDFKNGPGGYSVLRLPEVVKNEFTELVISDGTKTGKSVLVSVSLAQIKKQPQLVYFIQAGLAGSIKIGIAQDVDERLNTLQTGNSEKLYLLASLAGGEDLERYLHLVFAKSGLRGEWFAPDQELLNFIGEIKKLETLKIKTETRAIFQENSVGER